MLKLFEERDRQTKSNKESRQRERDMVMKDNIRKFNEKEVFNQTLFHRQGGSIDFKNAAQTVQNKPYKQSIIFCDESSNKELERSQMKEGKMRQFLWENAPELKDLRKLMLTADVARNQAMQMAEKRAFQQLQREEERCLAEEVCRERKAHEAEEKRKELEETRAKKKYHQDLDELRRYKHFRDSSSENQLQRERDQIDEIKKQIMDEDFRLNRERLEKQRELRRQMLELQEVRASMKWQEKLKESSDSQKVDEYRKAQELREKEQDEKRKLEAEQRLQVQEELLLYLERECRKRLESEQLRVELAIEEKEVEEKERVLKEDQKRMKIKDDLQTVYDLQQKVKEQKQDLMRKEEQLFRQNLMKKLYEEDKLEQMGQHKRRQKQIEHKHAVEAMFKEISRRRAAEKLKEDSDNKYHKQQEAERQKVLEEEKIRFLKEHASELLGYLPKGTFKDNQTIDLLGEEIKNFYFRRSCDKERDSC